MVSVTPTFSQVIPSAYGYVLAAAASSGFVLVWQSVLVGGARKAAKIPVRVVDHAAYGRGLI